MNLNFKSVIENSDLVSPSVLSAVRAMGNNLPNNLLVAEIDPQFMGGKELCEHYQVDPSMGANCVIVEAVKGDAEENVAIIVPVGYRADLNHMVRKLLNVKRVSLAPLEQVLKDTQMEYGSITPFGLPSSWKILVDSRLRNQKEIIVGGGKQISKLLLPIAVLENLPNVQWIEELSKQV